MQSMSDEKYERVSTAEVGTIIAFSDQNGKVRSAKIVEKFSEDEKFEVVTAYGKEFTITYSDVVWVKTGDRWPRGVYDLLKGRSNER